MGWASYLEDIIDRSCSRVSEIENSVKLASPEELEQLGIKIGQQATAAREIWDELRVKVKELIEDPEFDVWGEWQDAEDKIRDLQFEQRQKEKALADARARIERGERYWQSVADRRKARIERLELEVFALEHQKKELERRLTEGMDFDRLYADVRRLK